MKNKNKTNEEAFKEEMASNYKEPTIEIARSYSRKVALEPFGNHDFFASAKAEVGMDQAQEMGKQLIESCVLQVERDIIVYRERAMAMSRIQSSVHQKKLDGEHVEKSNGAYDKDTDF